VEHHLSYPEWVTYHREAHEMESERRLFDRQIGELAVELRLTRESLISLEQKVDDLMAAKNKGMGILLAVGAISGTIGAVLSSILEWQHFPGK
jgi:hypothetical protein